MKRKRLLKNIIFISLLVFMTGIVQYDVKSAQGDETKKNLTILINLNEERLYLIDKDKNTVLKKYNIASGKAKTPSPVGTWRVTNMEKSSGVFGTRWIGLNVPWGGFGIHGTNRPGTIGYETSHGCIRMFNKDIEELYQYVGYGMIVTIYAGPKGPFERGIKTLRPGDRGAAVLEVQKRLKEKGYYKGKLTGIYGERLKLAVIKFRKENNLKSSCDIDYEFCKKLGI